MDIQLESSGRPGPSLLRWCVKPVLSQWAQANAPHDGEGPHVSPCYPSMCRLKPLSGGPAMKPSVLIQEEKHLNE